MADEESHADSSSSSSAPTAVSAVARELRHIAIASYLPSFGLSIAHGVLSHQPVPAVGLIPQSVSAVTSFLLLKYPAPPPQDHHHHHHHHHPSDEEVLNVDAADVNPDAHSDPVDPEDETRRLRAARRSKIHRGLTHPISVFLHDVVLAAALMVVLVFTWINHGNSASLSMLAAYATLPILASFFAHLFAAAQALHHGFAFRHLFQWVAWQAVPAECPNCNYNLRPSSLPELPWVESLKKISWRRQTAAAPLLAEDDPSRYRDDPHDEAEPSTPQPEPVVIQSKRNKKTKATPAPSDEASDADLPWASSARGN